MSYKLAECMSFINRGALMAEPTRLELAASCVTGRRSNRLNYGSAVSLDVYLIISANRLQEKNVEKKAFLH